MMTYLTQVLLNATVMSMVIAGLSFIKAKLDRQITKHWSYQIDFLFLLLLSLPLLPRAVLILVGWSHGLLSPWSPEKPSDFMTSLTGSGETGGQVSLDWLQDFSLSVNRFPSASIIALLVSAWLIGMLVSLIVTLICHQRIRQIKKSASLMTDEAILVLYKRCQINLNQKKVSLLISSDIQTPMTIGLVRPCILLPESCLVELSEDDLYHILLHELTHCQKGDLWVNQVLCIFQILYWFNPLVLKLCRQTRLDRERACDAFVLSNLQPTAYQAYGLTLLYFASKTSPLSRFNSGAAMGDAEQEITKRIVAIAEFSVASQFLKRKSQLIFVTFLILSLGAIPLLSILALENDSVFEFKAKNVRYEDLSADFTGFNASFVLYDVNQDNYTIYNHEKSVTRLSPVSTYKIYAALFALDSQVIQADKSTMTWDQNTYPFPVWNQDQTLHSAMANSVSWYFQNTDQKIGLTKLQTYYKNLGYGNYDLSGGITDYWQVSSLKISPIEQVQLLTKFSQNKLEFAQEHLSTVKNAIKLSETDNAVLFGKTGTGIVKGKTVKGWFVGFVEKSGQTYVFATIIQNKDQANGSQAAKITLELLANKGIYNRE